MKILVVTPTYPYPAHEFSGLFNERCVRALKEYCERIEVLAPRPYVPRVLSVLPLARRWKAYATIKRYEVREGVPIVRPACLQIPRVASRFWVDRGAFLRCLRTAREMHERVGFDGIMSFDLQGAGGLAWRLGHDLGIPASGWATGEVIPRRPLERLDLIFYQSRYLLEEAARLVGVSSDELLGDKHLVLARGIPEPPLLCRREMRERVRSAWGISDKQFAVLSLGRIDRKKGIFELLEAMSIAASLDPRLVYVMVGSKPGFDDTESLQRQLAGSSYPKGRTRIFPACGPERVWEFLCGADIFVFGSHREGMPNSLLEAMVMGVPAVAFGIPPVLEIEGGTNALITVPAFDSRLFAKGVLKLAASAEERGRTGQAGERRVLDSYMVRKNMAIALERLGRVRRSNQNAFPAQTRNSTRPR